MPAADVAADAALPKARKKKPRPTFADGSLTRQFKFPSKSYPRSTYYVTATEIIIRIKKARKKWKLVIPKKRVVSYRTNRWFATPRWVEIELTFTQASRLGFVEPQPRSKAQALETAGAQEGDLSLADGGGASADNAASGAEAAYSAADEAVFELVPDGDEPALSAGDDATDGETQADSDPIIDGEGDSVDEDQIAPEASQDASQVGGGKLDPEAGARGSESEFTATGRFGDVTKDDESADTYDVAPTADLAAIVPADTAAVALSDFEPGLELAATSTTVSDNAAGCGSSSEPLATTAAAAMPDAPTLTGTSGLAGSVSVPTIGADRRVAQPVLPVAPPPVVSEKPARRSNTHRLMALMMVSAGAAAAWILLGDSSGQPVADNSAPAWFEPAISRTQEIVTGSIADANVPRPALDAHTLPERAILSVPAAIDPPESSEPHAPEVAIAPAEHPSATSTTAALMAPEPAPETNEVTATSSEPVALAATDRPCEGLAAAAQAIKIHFDYASAALDPASAASLGDFALRLHACGAGMIIIEGHADSDGDAGRNQAVSVRRAQAVREHLVQAGARPDQLSVIGFGNARPAVPNDTAENKHRNRRAVLVVDGPR